MLVLTRKSGEQIIIGRNVHVTVLGIKGNRVQLGFAGPADVPIHRQEVEQTLTHFPPALECAECA
jgi:carbon storage regulator